MGKMKGYDDANLATGYSDKSDDEGESRGLGKTLRQIAIEWQRNLGDEYMAIATVTGDLGGFTVYSLQCPTLEQTDGLKPDRGFRYWARVRGKTAITAFLNHSERVIKELTVGAPQYEEKLWRDFQTNLSDNASDINSKVYKVSRSMLQDDLPIITLSGDSGCHKYVVPLHWFPKNVQDLDPSELLTILPPSERDSFCLLLGRLMCGAPGANISEGELLHRWRSYGVVVGKPGIGKSTLLGYLLQALDRQGYTHATLDPQFGRFGWADVATADLAYIDDLELSGTERMIKSAHIKTCVTGTAPLFVEDKGVKGIAVKPSCTVLALCNAYDYGHYIGADPGQLSRLNMLDTYSMSELGEIYQDKDARILEHWTAVSGRLGTTPVVLMQRLLRHCADRFVQVNGYSLEPSGLEQAQPSQLEATMGTNRDNYRIDVSLRHVSELVTKCGWMVAYAHVYSSAAIGRKMMRELGDLCFSPDLLLAFMTIQCYPAQDMPEELKLESLSPACIPYIKPKLSEYTRMKAITTMPKAFMTLLSEMRSENGFAYPGSLTHYQALWQQVKREIPIWIKMVPTDRTEEWDDQFSDTVTRFSMVAGLFGDNAK
jgi:Family of unknown function (DUF5906)